MVSVLDVCGGLGAAGCTSTPSCAVSLSVEFFQSTQLGGCAECGGEGDVDQGVFARAYLEDHQSRAELGPMPASTGCPDGNWKCSGEWLGPGEGLPLIGVLADVESGAWVGAGPIIQHHSTRRWLRSLQGPKKHRF